MNATPAESQRVAAAANNAGPGGVCKIGGANAVGARVWSQLPLCKFGRAMGCSSSREKVFTESKYNMGADENDTATSNATPGGEMTDLGALQPDKPEFAARKKKGGGGANELSKYKGAASTGNSTFVGGQKPKVEDPETTTSAVSSSYSTSPASKATGKEDGVAEAPSPRPNYGD